MQPINEHEAAKRLAAQKYLDEYDKAPRNYFRGALGALSGALAGAMPWALLGASTMVVHVWVGFIIALLAGKGYDRFKGRPGRIKLLSVIVSTVVGLMFGELMLGFISILSNKGLVDWLVRLGINVVEFYTYNFSEYLRIATGNIAAGCICATPAVVMIWFKAIDEFQGIQKLRNYLAPPEVVPEEPEEVPDAG